MDEIRTIAPSGAVGAGYDEASFQAAMEHERPHFIGCDSGSTDPGPFPLGSGVSHWNRVLYKRDLAPMLRAALKYQVPLLIGSAGSAGGDLNLAWGRGVLLGIGGEEGVQFKLGGIHLGQERD